MTKSLLCLLALLFAAAAYAQPTTYFVQGTFSDGGTFNGTFTYDESTNMYSNVLITTTPGSVRTTGATYRYVCGQDVPSCTGVSPDATGYLNLTSTSTDQTGMPAMSIFFPTPLSPAPQGFADTAPGLFSLEAHGSDATCTSPAGASRSTDAGIISSS